MASDFQAPSLDLDIVSADIGHKKSSMIYKMLPAVVQTRIPSLPSIRRTIGDVRLRAGPSQSAAETAEMPFPPTPPPDYSSRPGSAVSNISNRSSFVSADGDISMQDELVERPVSSMSTPPPFPISETRTGINWKYANQGISLQTQAYTESQSYKVDETSTVLTRQLYVHGMTYLLRGLPSDLTPEESISLQAAIPQSIASIQNEPCAHALVPFAEAAPPPRRQPAHASILHRITAIIVFETFVMIQFLLPYVKLFIGHAYRFERDHKLTQRLMNNGLMTADAVRRGGIQLSHTICQMNDGKVGQALNDMTLWCVQGLTGGLQQGITEGVSMMGKERPESSKGRVEKLE